MTNKNYIHKVINKPLRGEELQTWLDTAGQTGWELVAISKEINGYSRNREFIFKKEIDPSTVVVVAETVGSGKNL